MAKRIYDPVVNGNTGELLDNSRIIELEPGDRLVAKAQLDFLRKKNARYEDQTDFVWLKFQYGTNLEFGVDKAVAVRFLYFGTACGNNGIIHKNKLMQAKLTLDKNQQTAFFHQASQSGLLWLDRSALHVNPAVVSRGEYDSDSDRIRVFSGFYRKLCESAHKQTDLNRIFYFLQMIPYLNRQTNILSHNQTEQELERIVYMPFNEFCKKIEFNTAHSAKLKKQLSAFRVDDELIIGFFNDISELTPSGNNAILNPKLCFGGDRNNEKYKQIRALFESEKNTYISNNQP